METVEFITQKDREKLVTLRIAEFASDEETKSLFFDVCTQLSQSDITDEELIDFIKTLPYCMSVAIINSVENRNKAKLSKMLRAKFYDEFIKSVNTVDKKGVSQFEKRVAVIGGGKVDRFYGERLISLEEIESLIRLVVDKSDLEDKSFKNTRFTYNGDNKYLRMLVRVRAQLINKYKSQGEIIEKTKLKVLSDLLYKVKRYNSGIVY